MCGIMGLIGHPSKKDAVSFINKGLSVLEIRGKDATGIFYTCLSSEEKNIIKAPLSSKEFLKKFEVKVFIKEICKFLPQEDILILGHCRAATQGSPQDNKNNHPLYSENWILIHNGVISGDVEIINPSSDTDSEILLQALEQTKDMSEIETIKKAISQISGSLAIALVNKKTNNVYLYRHSNPLYCCKTKSGIVFASTESILKTSIKEWLPETSSLFKGIEIAELEENSIYLMTKDDTCLIEKVSPKIKVYELPSFFMGRDFSTYRNYSNYNYLNTVNSVIEKNHKSTEKPCVLCQAATRNGNCLLGLGENLYYCDFKSSIEKIDKKILIERFNKIRRIIKIASKEKSKEKSK